MQRVRGVEKKRERENSSAERRRVENCFLIFSLVGGRLFIQIYLRTHTHNRSEECITEKETGKQRPEVAEGVDCFDKWTL